jgi:hypothetical protein
MTTLAKNDVTTYALERRGHHFPLSLDKHIADDAFGNFALDSS